MRYVVLIVISFSCVQKFHTKHLIPQHLPNEVPELVVTQYSDDRSGFEIDSVSYGSMSCVISSILVSKHEITNKYFCYFLNVDSIRTNSFLIKSIIDLSHPESKIVLTDGIYYPVKGYEDYPVVLVSWWGAKKYCTWLTEHVNKQREEKGLYRLANYRLPAEFEWMVASNANGTCRYPVEAICDSAGSENAISQVAHNVTQDAVNASGVAGINENVYEWTDDDFYKMEYIMDFSMAVTYYSEEIDDAVVRKHGYMGESSCGRFSRNKDGFYSDTGFRIVQTYIGRSSGVEF